MRMGAPSGVPMPDGEDADPLFCRAASDLHSPVVVPFAVGNENDDAAVALLGFLGEGEQRQRKGPSDIGALNRDERRSYLAGEGPRHAVIGGDGQLYGRIPGKDDHADPVLPEPVEELADSIFRAFEAVRLEILRQHRVGNIDNEHHLDPLAGLFAQLGTQLGPRRGEHHERRSRAEEQEPEPHTRGRSVGHEQPQDRRIAEAGEPAAAIAGRGSEETRHGGNEQQQPEKMGICESEHYGRDLNQRERARNSSTRSARPARAHARYSSRNVVYSVISTLLFSRVLISS